MTRAKPRTVPYRRKRSQQTNYHKRLRTLLSGKARLVVRLTNQRVIAQVINFTSRGDKVLAATDSFALKKLGWKYSCKNIPAAYLTGILAGKKAKAKGCNELILDTGLRNPLKKSKIFAFLKGVLDAGVKIPHSKEDIFPSLERIQGKHIQEYALKMQIDKEKYNSHFAQYLKNKIEPAKITAAFEEIKKKN